MSSPAGVLSARSKVCGEQPICVHLEILVAYRMKEREGLQGRNGMGRVADMTFNHSQRSGTCAECSMFHASMSPLRLSQRISSIAPND